MEQQQAGGLKAFCYMMHAMWRHAEGVVLVHVGGGFGFQEGRASPRQHRVALGVGLKSGGLSIGYHGGFQVIAVSPRIWGVTLLGCARTRQPYWSRARLHWRRCCV